ncbi:MAG: lipopolysaccharide heptosyltransferase II [Candidatus Dactylopiibacterium carminicum]|uniref:lipopolysaccharide heptosyltransferase II n=1 Tax=Candidatus Dactylopiibacterium carminicum TaxID=857335 RepID=A0A272ENG0_9RHOO|nr:lipopolysaccharide heptosyltransferase II [Candidatus Dactylopiibacterium carminicum]PAS91643.1 MAG: lipopolysaccharide heptosyltransferase II [Candidatus Dactylopiibacterium carminicum]PAS93617.1 MAG: lipopolysaccharide heptosyltransferase II [Candidatus Dactylopiibacterium carminicum]PAS96519.1 MAG: lipopolysaccharide heptosyltransferase II [Candidatus Dactylopiibacterium carminicum]
MPANLGRLLIVAPSWIGDTVAAQTLFMRLREKYPSTVIDALAPPWVAAVLRAMPEIDGEVLDNPFAHGQLRLKKRWALARQLRQRNYDAAYVLPNSLKSALIPAFAGIPHRVGFTGETRYGLINVRHTLDKQATPLQVERYAILAEAPGNALPRPYPLPALQAGATQIASTLDGLGLNAAPLPVIFCPGAEFGPAKRWPETHFAALARSLGALGIPVWLLGSKKDAAVGEEIARLAEGATRNLCGITNLSQAIHLLAMARHVVTNDSGLMHVAAALGTPLTALFGSSSPGYTPPLSDKAQVISLALSCSPCFKRECPLGHLDCLRGITPERIAASILHDDGR